MRYAFVARERALFPLAVLCRLLGFPRLPRAAGAAGARQGRDAAPRPQALPRREPRTLGPSSVSYRPTQARPRHRIQAREGWLYLAVVLSIQTRQVLGYSLSDRTPDDLVEHAFLNAWQRSPGPQGVLLHSDRGSQYASGDFRRTLTMLSFVPSRSRKAHYWDNAVPGPSSPR